ncbi:hypothetical protein GGR57DRAFT_172744 [Xylariaceae sp. FL1272]|nr:hypothetical protein GGR57DRAFT_172744 [Xylariaceae sp. FL1272]
MRGRGGPRPQRGRASASWSRLKPVDLDPLDAYGLPSKGDNRLLDPKTQERYYTKIVERYMAFCSDAGERDELLRRFASLNLSLTKEESRADARRDGTVRSAPSPDNSRALSDVLAALRKLREGIVASKRTDDFAIQAYLFCIRLSILVKHHESYHPAILHLLRRIHPVHNMTTIEFNEVVAYLVLDAACRRNNLSEAFALRHRYRLKDSKVDGILDALAHDNYVQFKRLKHSVDGHRAKLLEYSEETMRRHLLKCFGRTYLSVDLAFLETSASLPWTRLIAEDGVGWQLDGSNVTIRKVKGK